MEAQEKQRLLEEAANKNNMQLVISNNQYNLNEIQQSKVEFDGLNEKYKAVKKKLKKERAVVEELQRQLERLEEGRKEAFITE